MAGSKPTSAKKPKGRGLKTPSPSKVTRTTRTPKGKLSGKAAAAILDAVSAEFEDSDSGASIKTSRKSSPSKRGRGKTVSPRGRKGASPPKTPNRVKKASRKNKKKDWPYTHIPSRVDERCKNGRYEGRNLIVWTRPRMAEKFLLNLQYEIARHKIDVPWDAIAHRLHPGSSGSALLQYLNRLRLALVAEGHIIPPGLPKSGCQPADPVIRGYVRKYMEGLDAVTTRLVLFSEPMEDRKFNLPDAFENSQARSFHGSGRKKATVKLDSPDPADLDGDADYAPEVKGSGRRRLPRAATSHAEVKRESDDDAMSTLGVSCPEDESEDEDEDEEDGDTDMSDVHSSSDDDDDNDAGADDNGSTGAEEAAEDGSDGYSSSDNNGSDSGDSVDSQGYAFTGNTLMNDPFMTTPVHMNTSSGSVAGAMLHHSMTSPASYMQADALPSSALYYGNAAEASGYMSQFDRGIVSSPAGIDRSFASQDEMAGLEGTYANEDIDGEYDQLVHTPNGHFSQSVFTMDKRLASSETRLMH